MAYRVGIDGFVNLLSGVKPTGKVFPLALVFLSLSHLFPDADPQVLSLLSSLSVALNSLNGEGLVFVGSPRFFNRES